MLRGQGAGGTGPAGRSADRSNPGYQAGNLAPGKGCARL